MTDAEWWTAFGSIATAAGSIAAGVGLITAAIGLKYTAKIAHGDFLLHLDEMFWHHDKTHRRLLPERGEWGRPEMGPPPDDSEAWADIESYMGLFERIKVLVDGGIIDRDTVNRLYGYRVSNIVRNSVIRRAKLEHPTTKGGWTSFIALATSLGRYPVHSGAEAVAAADRPRH